MSGLFSPTSGGRPGANWSRAPALGLPLLAIALLIAGCGGSGNATSSDQTGVPKGQSATSIAKFAGTAAVPPKPVPPLSLNDSLGHRVNIGQFRGKAVLVTFIYDHCPDICPLIVGNLRTAQSELGPEAKNLQIIAVSVDPKGDTPATVKAFLNDHRMTGRMEYLIGSRPQLEKVWSDWDIVSRSSHTKKNPDAVEHSALIYGISGKGRITTLYPANFKPAQIVHDVPILASE
jgi:protein SCO1/2